MSGTRKPEAQRDFATVGALIPCVALDAQDTEEHVAPEVRGLDHNFILPPLPLLHYSESTCKHISHLTTKSYCTGRREGRWIKDLDRQPIFYPAGRGRAARQAADQQEKRRRSVPV